MLISFLPILVLVLVSSFVTTAPPPITCFLRNYYSDIILGSYLEEDFWGWEEDEITGIVVTFRDVGWI